MDTSCAHSTSGRQPDDDDAKPTIGKLAVFAPLVPLLVLLAVWLNGGFSRFDSPAKVAHALGGLRDSPLAIWYVLLGFGVGTLLFVPITALIAGTLLAFDPLHGFVYALLGVQLSAASTYWCGRMLGARALEYVSGSRIRSFRRHLREHALRASAAARVLPIGNFTLLNWLIGGMKVPFRWFILGNGLGVLPGLIVFSVFADRIESVVSDPQPEQIALLVGAGVGALLLGYLAQRLAKRLMA